MKKLTFPACGRLFACAVLVLFFTGFLQAQNEEAPQISYLQISYMKQLNADYPSIETDIWKAVHQQRIKAGKLNWWGFFQLTSPSGSKADYDYVTMNVYSSLEQMATSYQGLQDDFKAAHPGKDAQELMSKTGPSREILWTEVWRIIGGTPPPDGVPPVVVANHMKVKPDGGSEYVDMEMEVFYPTHKLSTEKGLRAGWALLGRVMPSGTSYGYDFMTFDIFNKLDDMAGPVAPRAIWEEAHKGKDLQKMMSELDVNAMREMVRTDVWRGIATSDE